MDGKAEEPAASEILFLSATFICSLIKKERRRRKPISVADCKRHHLRKNRQWAVLRYTVQLRNVCPRNYHEVLLPGENWLLFILLHDKHAYFTANSDYMETFHLVI